MKIYETDYFKAAPEWLKLALMSPEWVKQQSEAWNRHNKPENLGYEPPLFLEVKRENLSASLDQLARHYLSVGQRHLEVGKELLSVKRENLAQTEQ